MESAARESVDMYDQHIEDVGTLLRKTRESYGKRLSDVERVLRIRECQLAAIEAGDMARLPGHVYAIGFVRTYAEYLGLDGGEVVRLFKAQYLGAQPKQQLEFAIPASDTKTPSPLLAVGLAVVMCIALLIWIFSVPPAGNVTQIPEAPILDQQVEQQEPQDIGQPIGGDSYNIAREPEAQEAQNTDVPAQDGTAIPEMATPAPAQKGIILSMIENSWVEIKGADGKVIVSNVLKTGDQYFVPDNPGLTMSLGNAGGVEIIMDGRTMKPLGKTGDIRRDIPLDTDYLKTLEFKEDVPAPVAAPQE